MNLNLYRTLLGQAPVALTLFTLAACGGDGGTTPAPAPPPLQPLSWLDVPEDAISVRLGDPTSVDLRLSSAVEASYSIEPTDPRITVESEVLRAGVVRIVMEGVTPGESAVELAATATGYQTANARLEVLVEETGFGVMWEEVFGCQEFDILEEAIRRLLEEGLTDYVDFVAGKFISGQCGAFEDGTGIEWEGEEASLFDIPVIRVWGTPRTGANLLPAPRSQWWVFKDATSFRDPASEATFERSLRPVMDRVRALISN